MKFTFPLKPVAQLRDLEREAAISRLARAELAVTEASSALAFAGESLDAARSAPLPSSFGELSLHRLDVTAAFNNRVRAARRLADARHELGEAFEGLVLAEQRVESLSRLERRSRSEFDAEVERCEQREIDDMVLSRRAAKLVAL